MWIFAILSDTSKSPLLLLYTIKARTFLDSVKTHTFPLLLFYIDFRYGLLFNPIFYAKLFITFVD